MIRQIFTAVLLVMIAATSVQAQFLSDRLVPPQQVPLSPVPMVTQPADARVFGAERPKPHLWSLPFGVFPGTATVLSTEQRPVDWQRPVRDIPILASELDPTRPVFPLQPTSPRARMPGADPLQPAVLARFTQLVEPLVPVTEDPSAAAALSVLTTAVALATPNSAPLLRLSIPDPFEQVRTIRLATPPADSDDPVIAQDRPPQAKLPMVEPPKVAE